MEQTYQPGSPSPEPAAAALRKPIVTYALIALNLLAFVALTAAGGSSDAGVLVRFGAKDSALIWQGQYWRLLTPVFLHSGFLHLAFNSYAVLQLGRLVELLYGPIRMLLIYLSAGILATTASLIGSPALSVGASGAIFGLFGAVLYFGCRRPHVFRAVFGYRLFIVLAVNVFIGFSVPNIDNFAHLGGLISGFLAAAAVQLPNERRRAVRAALVALFFLAAVAYALFPAPTSWRYHYYSGRSMLERDQAGPATDHLEQAYRLRPRSKDVRLSLAQGHFDLGKASFDARRYDDAAAHFVRSAEVYPTAEGRLAAALSYAAKGDNLRAADECRAALKLRPNYLEAKDLLKRLTDG